MNYSKLVGQVLGGLVGLAGGVGLDVGWIDPTWLAALSTLIGGAIGTYVAPPNRPAPEAEPAQPFRGGF